MVDSKFHWHLSCNIVLQSYTKLRVYSMQSAQWSNTIKTRLTNATKYVAGSVTKYNFYLSSYVMRQCYTPVIVYSIHSAQRSNSIKTWLTIPTRSVAGSGSSCFDSFPSFTHVANKQLNSKMSCRDSAREPYAPYCQQIRTLTNSRKYAVPERGNDLCRMYAILIVHNIYQRYTGMALSA